MRWWTEPADCWPVTADHWDFVWALGGPDLHDPRSPGCPLQLTAVGSQPARGATVRQLSGPTSGPGPKRFWRFWCWPCRGMEKVVECPQYLEVAYEGTHTEDPDTGRM
ncbi:hypothetical protein NDU88_001988 [Pleurodeles waltl]|uniref:Uncharacterized protein n=1 Tax=Pleurodeles waltl TaxID=8319 RepID=A0AAV7VXZ3_PLEWA|nr:hypothetical protein NDU88_001988 [Pleurodeles waltl]